MLTRITLFINDKGGIVGCKDFYLFVDLSEINYFFTLILSISNNAKFVFTNIFFFV